MNKDTMPTPGPWSTTPRGPEQVHHIQAGERTIAQVWDFPEAEANARLIAVSPDLLALAQAVSTHFDGTDAPLGEAARALIAKATGK